MTLNITRDITDRFLDRYKENLKKLYFLIFWFYQSVGWILRNFKTLIFKPKLTFFGENRKTDNQAEFLDSYEFILYMIA